MLLLVRLQQCKSMPEHVSYVEVRESACAIAPVVASWCTKAEGLLWISVQLACKPSSKFTIMAIPEGAANYRTLRHISQQTLLRQYCNQLPLTEFILCMNTWI